MSISIRSATIDDCDTIYSFVEELAVSLNLRHKMISTIEDLKRDGFGPNPNFKAIIAVDVVQPVGVALYFFTYSSWAGRKVLNLHDLIVSQRQRRNGVGRKLIAHLAGEAKRADCARIDLEVRSYNEARKFYEKLGFTQDKSNFIYEINHHHFERLSQ